MCCRNFAEPKDMMEWRNGQLCLEQGKLSSSLLGASGTVTMAASTERASSESNTSQNSDSDVDAESLPCRAWEICIFVFVSKFVSVCKFVKRCVSDFGYNYVGCCRSNWIWKTFWGCTIKSNWICLWPEFHCPEVTLYGWQHIKIQWNENR